MLQQLVVVVLAAAATSDLASGFQPATDAAVAEIVVAFLPLGLPRPLGVTLSVLEGKGARGGVGDHKPITAGAGGEVAGAAPLCFVVVAVVCLLLCLPLLLLGFLFSLQRLQTRLLLLPLLPLLAPLVANGDHVVVVRQSQRLGVPCDHLADVIQADKDAPVGLRPPPLTTRHVALKVGVVDSARARTDGAEQRGGGRGGVGDVILVVDVHPVRGAFDNRSHLQPCMQKLHACAGGHAAHVLLLELLLAHGGLPLTMFIVAVTVTVSAAR